jgi:hypothetical protein
MLSQEKLLKVIAEDLRVCWSNPRVYGWARQRRQIMEIAALGNAQPCSFPKNAQFLRALVVVGIFGPSDPVIWSAFETIKKVVSLAFDDCE